MRIVFDTNVIVSAILSKKSKPGRILEMAIQGKFLLVVSPYIWKEIERVFQYPKIVKELRQKNISPEDINEFLSILEDLSLTVPGNITVEAVKNDPSDNAIIACAVEGEADFIISGDHHLTDLEAYRHTRIVNPETFLRIIGQ
ncbi:MAG: putative toxin-antitoxin system toxin component, PIN family [Dehalobacter sp. 4CP]|nr:putative toxin-antitoxin system toxin component, PIN family [Dehalobacter sp. 4CP]